MDVNFLLNKFPEVDPQKRALALTALSALQHGIAELAKLGITVYVGEGKDPNVLPPIEFPKWVGDKVVHSAEEEAALVEPASIPPIGAGDGSVPPPSTPAPEPSPPPAP